LVAVPEFEDGVEVHRYFVEDDPDVEPVNDLQPLTAQDLEEIRSFAGMWSDLDWDEMEAGLEEIRRSSKPSPPLDDV
jgi:hypothetical protein